MKAGLEIHQQLDTKEKLFCSCPTKLSDLVEKTIKRKLKPIAGETGEIDIAAYYEYTKDKTFLYEYHPDYACLVELDEEPPHLINEEALKLSLILAEFFQMYVPPILQVMRKTVVDGSNTSGFQRTLLVGLNGKLDLNGKEITIQTLCLEEDAARKIKETEKEVVYRLDRLGIPLLEIATSPDLKSPEEVKLAAEKIGLILRLTGKVKRGLGTIRQDINISIPNGEKIEIKGAQDLKLIPRIVEYEILRQTKLLEWQKLVKERGIEEVNGEIKEVTHVFEKTESKLIRKLLDSGSKVFALRLPGFKGLIGYELLPGRRIGTELAELAKRYGFGGIFHSDELPNYGISEGEVEMIRLMLECKENDAFILVVGEKEKSIFVLNEILKRLNEMIKKVPKDTRQVNKDGTTSFLRPQPGSARMYPETDHPLIKVKRSVFENEKYHLITYFVEYAHKSFELKLIKLKDKDFSILESIKEGFVLDLLDPDFRKRRLKFYGLSDEMVNNLLWSKYLSLFEDLIKKYDVKPSILYYIFFQVPPEIQKEYGIQIEWNRPLVEDLVKMLSEGRIVRAAVPKIVVYCIRNNKTVEEAVKELNLERISGEELKNEILKILNELKEIDKRKINRIVIGKLRERANPNEILKILQEIENADIK